MLDKTTNRKPQPSNCPFLSKPSPAYPLHQEVTHSFPSDKQLNPSASPTSLGTKQVFSGNLASRTECRGGDDALRVELLTYRKRCLMMPICQLFLWLKG